MAELRRKCKDRGEDILKYVLEDVSTNNKMFKKLSLKAEIQSLRCTKARGESSDESRHPLDRFALIQTYIHDGIGLVSRLTDIYMIDLL